MASSNILAWLFEIAADPSKAQPALHAFEASTASQLKNIAAHFDELQGKLGDALKFLQNRRISTAGNFERWDYQLLNTALEAARFSGEMEHAATRPSGSSGLLSRNISDLASPMVQGKKALDELAASATDSMGKLKPAHQLLLEIAEVFAKFPAGPEKNSTLELFAGSGQALVPNLNEGVQGVRPTEAGAGATATTHAEREKLAVATRDQTPNTLPEAAATQRSAQAHEYAAKAVKDHQTALTALAGKIPALSMPIRAELIPPLAEMDTTVGSISRRLTDQLAPSFQQSGEAARTFGQTVANAFIRATDASKGAVAMESARLAATLGFRRVAAGIEAVWETAKSIAAFAEWDIRGGILHAMSAAEYGIIAGSGGGHGRGFGGGIYGPGGGRLGGPGDLVRGRPVLGEGNRGQVTGDRGGGGTVVNVHIAGDFLALPAAVDQLASQLSDAVDRRDVVLRASHVKDSTLTRDSLNG